jgi:hypothetical protein
MFGEKYFKVEAKIFSERQKEKIAPKSYQRSKSL